MMKISVITPSLNKGRFLERTINSVLKQTGDFELEYIVVDGGSTDNALDILNKYKNQLTSLSEPDKGQSDAINKGFSMATGEITGWLNSDDLYSPGALQTVVEYYRQHNFHWCFGNCRNIDENDRVIRRPITWYKMHESPRFSYRRLLSKNFISQPAVFVSRPTILEIGLLDIDKIYSMDYDYWLRIAEIYRPCYINKYLACYRWHKASKNGLHYRQAAYETFQTARQHAPPQVIYPVWRHYLHYHMLSVLYRFLR
jgi:glycosyltransferase involved in cell wall biosynthesis